MLPVHVLPLVPPQVPSRLFFKVEAAEALDLMEVVLGLLIVLAFVDELEGILPLEIEEDFVEEVAGREEVLLEEDVPQVPEAGIQPAPQ